MMDLQVDEARLPETDGWMVFVTHRPRGAPDSGRCTPLYWTFTRWWWVARLAMEWVKWTELRNLSWAVPIIDVDLWEVTMRPVKD